MAEFFGFGGYTRPAEGFLSWQHLTFVTALMAAMVLLPAVIIAFLFGLKTLANAMFGLQIGNDVLFLSFFAVATPLGLNTVVFPEAFGGNPETGASMSMISHTLCVISIPLMYALMVAVFGTPFC